MVSDERHEVAENLRYLTIGNCIRYKEQFFYELADVVVGFEDHHDFDVVLEKLADLIDRSTCHDATDNFYEFVCSKCGCSLDISNDFEPTLWVDGKATVPSYCPNCGAEVTEDD